MTNTISKSKLKAIMFDIFRQLEASREELIVTDCGKPVLKIVPIKSKQTSEEMFRLFQGRVHYHEDINLPTIAEWNDPFSKDNR